MRWPSALAIWFLFWFLSLFFVLPFFARTSDEAGEAKVPGQADSAPVRFPFGRVVLWTTVVGTVLFGLFLTNYVYGWLTADMLDFSGRSAT